MENQFTHEILGGFVERRGSITCRSADGIVIGKIEPGKLDDWQLAVRAAFFDFEGLHYNRADFQELVYREMLPSNPIQIDLPA